MLASFRVHIATIGITISLLTGCAEAMSNRPQNSQSLPNEWPIHFKEHNFSAHCYNTVHCKVVYNKFDFTGQIEEQPSGQPPEGDYKSKWTAPYVGIQNFPSPVEVEWTTPDGQEHVAHIDLGDIFRDQVVLHKVAKQDIPEGWAHGVRPDILLEVNGKTINVYMRAHIATKEPQITGNKYSNFRNDVILAWSHTY